MAVKTPQTHLHTWPGVCAWPGWVMEGAVPTNAAVVHTRFLWLTRLLQPV